jgi:hypothetical protein
VDDENRARVIIDDESHLQESIALAAAVDDALSATLCATLRACYELPGQFASRASMTSAKTAKCIPFSVAASLS